MIEKRGPGRPLADPEFAKDDKLRIRINAKFLKLLKKNAKSRKMNLTEFVILALKNSLNM